MRILKGSRRRLMIRHPDFEIIVPKKILKGVSGVQLLYYRINKKIKYLSFLKFLKFIFFKKFY